MGHSLLIKFADQVEQQCVAGFWEGNVSPRCREYVILHNRDGAQKIHSSRAVQIFGLAYADASL